MSDIELVKLLGGECLVFYKNDADLNNICRLINDRQVSEDLTICPKFIINTHLHNYQSAKNLSIILRIPLFNIIEDINNIKKEGAMALAPTVDQDINFLLKEEFAEKLFLTNFKLIKNIQEIPNLITETLNTWKLI